MTKNSSIERLESVVPYASDHAFPLENLPWTVFSTQDNPAPRCAVRIADQLVDLTLLSSKASSAFSESPLNADQAAALFSQSTLNAYLAQPRHIHRAFRAFLQHILSVHSSVFTANQPLLGQVSVPIDQAKLHLPIRAGDYTDFCASKYHCTATGRLMFNDPTRPLEAQWFQLPIAYHGRSSSLVVSGTNFARPQGIFRTKPGSSDVEFGPSKRMDFELEVAYVIGGSNGSSDDINALGQPVRLDEAEDKIFGMMLMNDWSARDIQSYEMNPLGPFTGKNFATTLSPYLVELDALAPFRTASPAPEHTPFAYLDHKGRGTTWDVQLQAFLSPQSEANTEKVWTKITDTSLKHVYWTAAQMVAHHTITGCNLRAADTFATGTVSGPFEDAHSEASLIEACKAGRQPIQLNSAKVSGETQTRCFLEDGDEVRMTGFAYDPDSKLHIGLGECSGQLLPAVQL